MAGVKDSEMLLGVVSCPICSTNFGLIVDKNTMKPNIDKCPSCGIEIIINE